MADSRNNIDAQLQSVQKSDGEDTSNEKNNNANPSIKEKIPFMFSNSRHTGSGIKWVLHYDRSLYHLPQKLVDLLEAEKQSMKRGASESDLEVTQRRVRARYSSSQEDEDALEEDDDEDDEEEEERLEEYEEEEEEEEEDESAKDDNEDDEEHLKEEELLKDEPIARSLPNHEGKKI